MLPSDEQRISLKAACQHRFLAVDGRALSIASVYRKALQGTTGMNGQRHKLETEIGARGALVTTNEAIVRFVEAINTRPTAPADPIRSAISPTTSREIAAATLNALGF